MLASLGGVEGMGVEGMTVLDLFAGCGSFGLECLSRGAQHVTFVERDGPTAAVIEENLSQLGFSSRAAVKRTSVASALASVSSRVDLAFCDPPYADDVWPELLPVIPADLLVGHASAEISLVPPWRELKRRRYGRARIVIAESEPELSGATD